LDALRVGELTVLIEQGPCAILAAVVRGDLSSDGRLMLQEALEAIQRRHGPELRAFNGDATPFQRSRFLLESCLLTQYRRPNTRAHWRMVVVAVAIFALLGAWLLSNVRERRQWGEYLTQLDAEPGIVVVSSGRRNGRFFVVGLRDPLARDPDAMLEPNLRSQSNSRWEPYDAVVPAFVVARAARVLRPPAGVTLEFQDGALVVRGVAPERWIVDSERLALALPGIYRFVYDGTSADASPGKSIGRVDR
jgi:OOP family OmpA-OmpF porin